MEEKSKVYKGNLFWLLSVKKTVNKENHFTLNLNNKSVKEANSKTISSNLLIIISLRVFSF